MKKIVMMLALASFSVAGMAQSETPTEKYSVSTNSFWSNWFIQGNVTWSAFYATDPAGKHNGVLSAPFHKFPTGTLLVQHRPSRLICSHYTKAKLPKQLLYFPLTKFSTPLKNTKLKVDLTGQHILQLNETLPVFRTRIVFYLTLKPYHQY